MKHSSNRLKYLVLGIVFFVLGIGDGKAQASISETIIHSGKEYDFSNGSASLTVKKGDIITYKLTAVGPLNFSLSATRTNQ